MALKNCDVSNVGACPICWEKAYDMRGSETNFCARGHRWLAAEAEALRRQSMDAICPPAEPRVVLVCGGQDFTDAAGLARVMNRLMTEKRITLVIHGAYRGADFFARDWARERSIKERGFPADWDRLGRAAGPTRNAQMLTVGKPDLVVAFPGGGGTADMIRQARAAGVRVRRAVPRKLEPVDDSFQAFIGSAI